MVLNSLLLTVTVIEYAINKVLSFAHLDITL